MHSNKRAASEHDAEERELRVQRVLDECIDRRIAGERVSAAEIVEAHPELMPELRDRLRHLDVIERARRRATGSSQFAGRLAEDEDRLEDRSRANDIFSGYEILNEIHRGGQGVVYRARQRATGRDVALKVIREGDWASPRELARFDREVQILAGLRHPNIVTVHDRGETAGGSAFIVMDYIAGRTLESELANDDGTSSPRGAELSRRAKLFRGICEAVAAAHLRGVIHRDIKPGNIRVDEAGEPHILDFGLAKLTPGSGETDPTAMTATGQFVGSAAWASPEQAAGAADVDLRSDVYSLGVLLFRMLTGRMPYEIGGLLPDVLDRVRTAPPHRPRRLNPAIDGDLETIVLKCLAKEPARRYDTAAALATDLRRREAGEPIDARRDSTVYVLRKILRRHRVLASAIAVVVVVIVGAAGALGVLYQQQRRATEQARNEAATSGAVITLFQDLLGAAGPAAGRGPDYPVRELLDDFTLTLWDQLDAQPEVEATIRLAIGNAYLDLTVYERAEAHLRRALELRESVFGAKSAPVAEVLYSLAWLYNDQDEWAPAERAAREALEIRQGGAGGSSVEIADSLDQIGVILQHRGDYAGAEMWHREALTLREPLAERQPLGAARTLRNLALARQHLGDTAAADELYREALAICEGRLPEEHPQLSALRSDLASVLKMTGRYAEAEPMLRAVLATTERSYEADHPAVAEAQLVLAAVLRPLGKLAEAEALNRAALATYRAKYPAGHIATAITLNNLANVLRDMGRVDESIDLHREALEMRRRVGGPRHPGVANSEANLALSLWAAGEYDEALTHADAAVALCRDIYDSDHPRLAEALVAQGRVLVEVGRPEDAVDAAREALEIRRAALPEGHEATGEALVMLGAALFEIDEVDAARGCAREACEILRSRRPEGDRNLAEAEALLAVTGGAGEGLRDDD